MSRMLLGESGCGENKGGRKLEDLSRAGRDEVSLREEAGLGVGRWNPGRSRDLLHEGAELARMSGSRGTMSMR